MVDDEHDVGEMTSELLESTTHPLGDRQVCVIFKSSFEEALSALSSEVFNILVLDIRNQGGPSLTTKAGTQLEAGIEVFNKVRARCFIPVIFFTALPDVAESILQPPFVQVVSKLADDYLPQLKLAVARAIDSGLPDLLETVSEHVAEVERRFMSEFVEANWQDLSSRPDDLGYLLSRRMARSFEEQAGSLAVGLGQDVGSSDGTVHATRYYMQPPSLGYRMGDLLREPILNGGADDSSSLHIILTPSCDLVPRLGTMKAQYVVLAKCVPLDDFKEYRDWKKASDSSNTKRLRGLLKSRPQGQEDRYFYLPAAWNVPNCVVDLQSVTSIPCEKLEHYEKIASLDSPFAEALSYQFNRYMGRVGMPDLDIDDVIGRLDA